MFEDFIRLKVSNICRALVDQILLAETFVELFAILIHGLTNQFSFFLRFSNFLKF